MEQNSAVHIEKEWERKGQKGNGIRQEETVQDRTVKERRMFKHTHCGPKSDGDIKSIESSVAVKSPVIYQTTVEQTEHKHKYVFYYVQ